MPSRDGQLSRAISGAVQSVYVCPIRHKKLDGAQVTGNCGSVERGPPFTMVSRPNTDTMRDHRLDRAEISIVGSVYKQITGTQRGGHLADEQPLPNAAGRGQKSK